ncbi:hypothetical protein FACS1894217_11990 [Clostridia bacterium]|nr:hypothetical protein FACS1894217_11990 [Clostridia bacterium]
MKKLLAIMFCLLILSACTNKIDITSEKIMDLLKINTKLGINIIAYSEPTTNFSTDSFAEKLYYPILYWTCRFGGDAVTYDECNAAAQKYFNRTFTEQEFKQYQTGKKLTIKGDGGIGEVTEIRSIKMLNRDTAEISATFELPTDGIDFLIFIVKFDSDSERIWIVERTQKYTLQQLQDAMHDNGSFAIGDWGEGDQTVLAAKQVELDKSELVGEYETLDVSKATQWEITSKFKQSEEDYRFWREMWINGSRPMIGRDGEYSTLTGYYYFNDVKGKPQEVRNSD